MMRITIENLFVFMLPVLGYIAWVAFKRNDWPGLSAVLRDAPLVKLFVSGAVFMLATLALFSSRSHNTPDEAYVPPVYKDGQLQPGRAVQPDPAPVSK